MLDRITVDPKICGGQACIRGMRIPVATILKLGALGKTPAEIIEDYPELEIEDIHQGLAYAAWLASEKIIPIDM